MPLPIPTSQEKKDGRKGQNTFVSRCISIIKDEYNKPGQAAAICYSQYRKSKKKSSGTFDHLETEKIEILD